MLVNGVLCEITLQGASQNILYPVTCIFDILYPAIKIL